MEATKKQIEEFNRIVEELDCAHGLRDTYEEINSLIKQLQTMITFINEVN